MLAQGVIGAPKDSIKRVVDQYLNFVSLEENMFVLGHKNSIGYHSLQKSDITDTEMDSLIDQIVDSLFSVCVALGTVPIIRCPKGNAAEVVSKKLDKKIRENLNDTRNSLLLNEGGAGQFSFCRPVLIILDRQIDLATPLHHTWTYQALAHDVLNYSLNRVTIIEEAPSASSNSKPKTRTCDLDPTDSFWSTHKGTPFPQVAEKIQEELEEYKGKEDDIKRMKHDMGVDGIENEEALGLLSGNTERLTSAVTSLPELLEKKKLIDMHTSMASCILEQIKARKLDVFFELEEKIMSKQVLGDKVLMDVFEDPESGTPEDKMRLFLIYFLCSSDDIPDTEVDQYVQILENLECDINPLRYLQRVRSINRLSASNNMSATDYSGGGTKTVSMFGKLMAHSSNFVMEGVKNLVIKKHSLPVTRIAEEIMEARSGKCQDNYLYFDPKILKSNGKDIPKTKNPFQEGIVFMVGGGNYIEYQNLIDQFQPKIASSTSSSSVNLAAMAASGGVAGLTSSKKIIYGCTALHNANEVIKQLSKLGSEL